MPGFSVYSGNSLELLFDRLTDNLTSGPKDPFTPEIIVVQSQGMKRWLSLKIAEKTGIAAGYEFIFPNKLIDTLFNRVLNINSDARFINKEGDVWRTMEIISKNSGLPPFFEISHYLGSPSDPVKLYQLASKLIDLFDQYITYRPAMILEWDAGSGEDEWQSHIWRELFSDHRELHPPALKKLFTAELHKETDKSKNLPERITLFGIPVLPRFHTEVLAAASGFSSVDLYFLNPSDEYWFDIKSAAAAAGAMKRSPGIDIKSLHFESGHPLLASMGRYAGEYINYLMSADIDVTEGYIFSDIKGESLLSKIQRDIMKMTIPPPLKNRMPLDIKKLHNERSLSINACHSPMREMEVLKDYLLECFETMPDLTASEVIVLSPDIEKYVPYINAVFGPGISSPEIPYSIVDRRSIDDTPGVRAFISLLELPEQRITATEAFRLFEFAPIRDAFGFTGSDIDEIKGWIISSGIRWGLDEDDRASKGLPAFGENSWRFGIDRLLLGYSMGGSTPFAGIIPETAAAEKNSILLGQFAGFINALTVWISFARNEHTLSGWSSGINDMLACFFPSKDNRSPLPDPLFKTIAFFENAKGQPLPLRVIAAHLKDSLSEIYSRGEFINGTLVFCSMLPMRSVPFRVVCLAGMNDRAFPRIMKAPDFDLMAKNPQAGDRSLPDEDRFLFLETLVSAKERFYVSYIGSSPADNTDLPPSVAVSELIDCLEAYYIIKDSSAPVTTEILNKHRLQPFSREYFRKGSPFYSYSQENLAASEAHLSGKNSYPFVKGSGNNAPSQKPSAINIYDLISFFKSPAQWYLSSLLEIDIKNRFTELEDNEPFSADKLFTFKYSQAMIKSLIKGDDTAPLRTRALLSGELPPGEAGVFIIDSIESESRIFFDTYSSWLLPSDSQTLSAEVTINGTPVTGTLALQGGNRLIDYRNSKTKPSDLTALWIKHLFLHSAVSPDSEHELKTIFIRKTEKESFCFKKPENPEEDLSRFIEIFMSAADQPARFFPATSYAYFAEYNKNGDRKAALNKAKNVWQPKFGGEFSESADRANRLVFRDIDPFGPGFEELALKIYSSLFSAMEAL